MTYEVIRKAKCDRCGHEYDSSNPTRHEFLTDWLEIDHNGIDEFEGYRRTNHLCPECRRDAAVFMENSPVPPARKAENGEPLALWERELLAPITLDDLLDELVEILYPMSEYRDTQWNGGDVCDALARIVDRERPEAKYRQPEEPSIFHEDSDA